MPTLIILSYAESSIRGEVGNMARTNVVENRELIGCSGQEMA